MPKNLILAFGPGSKGFLLSKWLYKNNLVNLLCPPKNTNLIVDNINHHLSPLYNDVLFYWANEKQKQIYQEIETELSSVNIDILKIKKLLSLSQHKTPTSSNNPYNLILSHHHTKDGLYALRSGLDATLCRITVRDLSQAQECHKRKFGHMSLNGYSNNYWQPWTESFDLSIDIALDKILELDIDFLKEKLS